MRLAKLSEKEITIEQIIPLYSAKARAGILNSRVVLSPNGSIKKVFSPYLANECRY